jgi:hypothetical protein
MFADPQSVTINAVATSLARTLLGNGNGEFTSADGNTKLITKQSTSATRFRREARITQQKISADPLNPGINTAKGFSVYLVIDEPRFGFTDTEIGYIVEALKGFVGVGNTAKILQGEY